MNERGRERTAAGLRTVGRRWAGEGGRGRREGACLLTLARVLKQRGRERGGRGEGGGRVGACLLTLTRVSYVF